MKKEIDAFVFLERPHVYPSLNLRQVYSTQAQQSCEPDGDEDKLGSKALAGRSSRSCGRTLLTLGVLYLAALSIVVLLFQSLPSLAQLQASAVSSSSPAEQLRLAIPRSFDEMRAVRAALERYHVTCPLRLAALLSAAHVFLQTFLTPGAACINVLAGSLYSPPVALIFITIVSTLGSACNFLLVRWQLKDVVTTLFPQRVASLAAEVRRHRAHLLHYALFLRVTPIFPAWFINVASPIVEIPFHVFLIATAVGHQPHNVLAIQAGRSLQTMQSLHDLYTLPNVMLLLGIGVVAILPKLFKVLLKKKMGGPALPVTTVPGQDPLHSS